MIQAIPKTLTFDEFIAWYPDNSSTRYELHDRVIFEVPKPTGKHSEVAGFTSGELFLEIRRSQLPYFIPKECVVKPARESSYEPDVIVLDKIGVTDNEPRWERESIITLGTSIRLVIEVVSTNWSDDYALKLEDYEAMGIPEYWIVDYLALGSRNYLGNPKVPTVFVYQLDANGVYQSTAYKGSDRIVSPTFPELELTVEQILSV